LLRALKQLLTAHQTVPQRVRMSVRITGGTERGTPIAKTTGAGGRGSTGKENTLGTRIGRRITPARTSLARTSLARTTLARTNLLDSRSITRGTMKKSKGTLQDRTTGHSVRGRRCRNPLSPNSVKLMTTATIVMRTIPRNVKVTMQRVARAK
jgi:hypothetical protein